MNPGRLANRGCTEDSSPTFAANWLWDESGQDVIEYALLAAIVAIASIGTWKLLVTAVFDVYSAADADVQGVSACTPDPGGGGCP